MTAWDPAILILMAEALVVMVVLGLSVFVIARNKRAKEMAGVEGFLNQLNDEKAVKSKLLETILIENCGIDRDTAAVTLQEVNDAERALLKRIIQLFLQRNPALLSEIDQLIANLSDPYCKLLAENSVGGSIASPANGSGTMINNKVAGLERINQQLMRQLATAMKTIDEITAEYTRVFSGNQTALELENSSKKMLQVFQESERQIKSNSADLEL